MSHFSSEGECLESLDTIQRLTPFLYDLAHFWQQPAAKAVLSVIQEKYDAYCKQPRVYPGTETVRRSLDSSLFQYQYTFLFHKF